MGGSQQKSGCSCVLDIQLYSSQVLHRTLFRLLILSGVCVCVSVNTALVSLPKVPRWQEFVFSCFFCFFLQLHHVTNAVSHEPHGVAAVPAFAFQMEISGHLPAVFTSPFYLPCFFVNFVLHGLGAPFHVRPSPARFLGWQANSQPYVHGALVPRHQKPHGDSVAL